MSEHSGKTYRPWEPERYQHEAQSPAAKLPEGAVVCFLLDTVRRFLLRGLATIRGAWRLVCLTHNLRKMWRYGRVLRAVEAVWRPVYRMEMLLAERRGAEEPPWPGRDQVRSKTVPQAGRVIDMPNQGSKSR